MNLLCTAPSNAMPELGAENRPKPLPCQPPQLPNYVFAGKNRTNLKPALIPSSDETLPIMSLDLIITIAAILLCLCITVSMIVLEKRPAPVGNPRMIPTTLILFVSILVMVIALAHLVTLLTGTPHVGRFG